MCKNYSGLVSRKLSLYREIRNDEQVLSQFLAIRIRTQVKFLVYLLFNILLLPKKKLLTKILAEGMKQVVFNVYCKSEKGNLSKRVAILA